MIDKAPAWLNPQISVGNILTIVALVVAGGMAWGSLRADQAAQDKRLTAVEAATSQRESRVRALETGKAVSPEIGSQRETARLAARNLTPAVKA